MALTSKQHDIKHALNAAEQTPLNTTEYYELRNGTQTGSINIKMKYNFSLPSTILTSFSLARRTSHQDPTLPSPVTTSATPTTLMEQPMGALQFLSNPL
jgi:hypothetical protein